MRKETDAGVGACNGVQTRPRRLLPRFSLRRLLYSSPLIGRRITRTPSASNRNKAKDATSTRVTDVEKGEARVSNGSSHFQFHNLDLQRTSSKGSVLPTAGKSNEHGLMECPLCLAELPSELFPIVQSCHHRSCYDCFQQYLKVEISESRINIACPECSEPLHPNDIRMILNDQTQLEKYEDFMVRRVLAVEPDARWCPAPDCSFAVIASGCASCPKLRCERPGCDSYFCYHCKARWHPNQTCDAARAQRSQYYERSSSLSFSQSDSQHRDDIKPCPRCQVLIVKMDDGSCNHMTCAVCGAEFCWLCMKEISDLHYLSPSGCTFWGKKPWSRKKKILWQLGTLVGAPVGIGLVAGIAVPAMIIGIPVWVGRKIYTRYENANKHKRNAFIAGGVTASVLVSPVLAGLAVGIGVPILLFYVYGVVPVSLCRSGGCGVSTNGSGVRFEFDDENELMGALGVRNAGDAASIDVASHRGGNPSIGEASLSLGSGSQLEKLGRENDRESASNVALAGTSLAGSIASSVLPGGQRLEVQADVTSTQRFSLCSETASAATSLSEKSVNASIALDDGAASTRALAGSVLNFKVDSSSTGGGRSTEGEHTIGSTGGGHMDSAGQAASLSSLEEIAPGLAKRTRRRPTLDRQPSDSSSWTVCGEDGGSERVRFDDHVSFIEADQEAGLGTCAVNNRGPGRRKRNKELEQDGEVPKSSRCSSSELNAAEANVVLDIDDEPRERVNVATLRSVFFHNPAACSDRETRLPVIVEPSVSQAQTSTEHIRLPVWEKSAENVSRENSAYVRLSKKNMTSSRITTESIRMTHMMTPSTVEAPIIKMPHHFEFESSSINSPVIMMPHEFVSEFKPVAKPVLTPEDFVSEFKPAAKPILTPEDFVSELKPVAKPVLTPEDFVSELKPVAKPVLTPEDFVSEFKPVAKPVLTPEDFVSEFKPAAKPILTPEDFVSEFKPVAKPILTPEDFVSEIKPVARPFLTPHEIDFKLSTIEKPIIKLRHHPSAPML